MPSTSTWPAMIQFVVHHVTDMTGISLEGLITRETDAVIALHEFDESSLAVCEYAHHIGVPRLIVRLHDMSNVRQLPRTGRAGG